MRLNSNIKNRNYLTSNKETTLKPNIKYKNYT